MTTTWPHLVVREATVGVLALALLALLSVAAPLDMLPPAEPGAGETAAKAPWFFVGLQEMLYHVPPGVPALLFPAVALLFLLALPYLAWNRTTLAELRLPTKLTVLLSLAFIAFWCMFMVPIPFPAQSAFTLLTAAFLCVGMFTSLAPSRLSLVEAGFIYLFGSYALWTFIGEFLRTPDWKYVWEA